MKMERRHDPRLQKQITVNFAAKPLPRRVAGTFPFCLINSTCTRLLSGHAFRTCIPMSEVPLPPEVLRVRGRVVASGGGR